MNTGLHIQLTFEITTHVQDKAILEKIKHTLKVGTITKAGSRVVRFQVLSIREVATLIYFFEKFILITQKHADFIL